MSISIQSPEELQRRLSLLQLQVNRLFEITQAINDNTPKNTLFGLYKTAITWELSIPRFVLFIRSEEQGWECPSWADIDEQLLSVFPFEKVEHLERNTKINIEDDALLREFEFVVPVLHKEYAIAYVLLGGGNLESRADIFETLRFVSAVTNVIAVAIENKRLFKRQLEQEKLRRELELAVQVQNMLIPKNAPKNDRFEIAGIYQPHKGVGGDYYDFWEIDDDIAFCIADISGKGIAAALLMSNFQASIQSLIHRGGMHVRDFIEQLNMRVLRTTKGEKFITFFIARYNYTHRRLLYVNAGHNPPIMFNNGQIHRLDKGCTVLGAFNKLPHVEYGCLYLDDDALFLLYTDGLTDLQNNGGAYFDDHFLENFIRENQSLPVSELNNSLLAHANRFKEQQEFPDDISFLSARIFVNAVPPKNANLSK